MVRCLMAAYLAVAPTTTPPPLLFDAARAPAIDFSERLARFKKSAHSFKPALGDDELGAQLTQIRSRLAQLRGKPGEEAAREMWQLGNPLRTLKQTHSLTAKQLERLEASWKEISEEVVESLHRTLTERGTNHRILELPGGRGRAIQFGPVSADRKFANALEWLIHKYLNPQAHALASKGRFAIGAFTFVPGLEVAASFQPIGRQIILDFESVLDGKISHSLHHELRHAQTDLLEKSGRSAPHQLKVHAAPTKGAAALPGEAGTDWFYGKFMAFDELLTYRSDLRHGAQSFATALTEREVREASTRWTGRSVYLSWIAERAARTSALLETALRDPRASLRISAGFVEVRDPRSGIWAQLPNGMVPPDVTTRIAEWLAAKAAAKDAKKAARDRTREELAELVSGLEKRLSEISGEVMLAEGDQLRFSRGRTDANLGLLSLQSEVRKQDFALSSLQRKVESKFTTEAEKTRIRAELHATEEQLATAQARVREAEALAESMKGEHEAAAQRLAELRSTSKALREQISDHRRKSIQLSARSLDEAFDDLPDMGSGEVEVPKEILKGVRDPLVRALRDARRLAEDRRTLAEFSQEVLRLAGRQKTVVEQQRLARALVPLLNRRKFPWEAGWKPLTLADLRREFRAVSLPKTTK